LFRPGLLYHGEYGESRSLAGFHYGAEMLIRETLEAAWNEAEDVMKPETPEPGKRWTENPLDGAFAAAVDS